MSFGKEMGAPVWLGDALLVSDLVECRVFSGVFAVLSSTLRFTPTEKWVY